MSTLSGSLGPSPPRSSREVEPASSLEAVATEQRNDSTAHASLQDFVKTLQSSNIPGPLVITGPYPYIGRGGQYFVYKAQLHNPEWFDVAIKIPLFGTNRHASLTVDSNRRYLTDLSTEVKALMTPHLQQHPNIIDLLCWSWEPFYEQTPVLVLELATSDLNYVLQNQAEKLSNEQKYTICSDVAAGLDAIHACGFIHGDLKPGNVLMCPQGELIVAKLADFGHAVGDLMDDTPYIRLYGTPKWIAPEVERGERLTRNGAIKADNYSFGLVMQKVMSSHGQPESESTVESKKMAQAVARLLCDDPMQRPQRVVELLDQNVNALECQPGKSVSARERTPEPDAPPLLHVDGNLRSFSWRLLPGWMEGKQNAPRFILWEMFLDMTAIENQPDFRNLTKYSALDILLEAAKQGFEPAEAAIPGAFKYYHREVPEEVEERLVDYLGHAVATGSVLARYALGKKNHDALSRALQRFQAKGGYFNFFVEDISTLTPLHFIALRGTVAELRAHLEEHPDLDIECLTPHGESPLYIACARGAWSMAAELLDRGADATTRFTSQEITCLHWLFAFQPRLDDILNPRLHDEVCKRLILGGCDVNTKATSPIPILHYPFQLPAGTPLHWAVVTHSYAAAQALVANGADPGQRDGSDPYRYDVRVRTVGEFSTLEEDLFSFSECGTEGLSPLDYAALDNLPRMLKLLLLPTQGDQVNSVDEEGFALLHRLSASPVRRTWQGRPFSFLPLVGSTDGQRERLEKIVEEICLHNGNMEQLTTPNSHRAQRSSLRRPRKEERYTPLMLAALNSRATLVQVLLKAGADGNRRNPTGLTALHCHGECPYKATDICRYLFEAGAKLIIRGSEARPSPLLNAAEAKNIELMDMMLSEGADLEETDQRSNIWAPGFSALFFLGKQTLIARKAARGYDESVAGFIDKWLLNDKACDLGKRARILSHCSRNDGTLLHFFMRSPMPCSVAALLRGDADVNAVAPRRQFLRQGETAMLVNETPLDMFVRNRVHPDPSTTPRYRMYSHAELQGVFEAEDEQVAILKRAGGKRFSELRTEPVLP